MRDYRGNIRPDPIDEGVDIGAIESSFEGHVSTPDTAFLHALIDEGADINGDRFISYGEAEAVTSLNVSGSFEEPGTISDLTGIEAFINLEHLDCASNQLASLDVTNNIALENLMCGNNHLTGLDVSNNEVLRYLDASNNPLMDLDLSGNTMLRLLDCRNCGLTELDITKNTDLEELYLGKSFVAYEMQCNCQDTISNPNKITSIDLSNCEKITELDLSGNLLKSIAISSNSVLRALCLCSMDSLHQICVWDGFSMIDKINIDTTGSPNVYFTAECNIGIAEHPVSNISIYPNPTNTQLTIESDLLNMYSIEITALNGQLILSREMQGTSYQIDLSIFKPGVYFVTIRSKDFVTTGKIIKL